MVEANNRDAVRRDAYDACNSATSIIQDMQFAKVERAAWSI